MDYGWLNLKVIKGAGFLEIGAFDLFEYFVFFDSSKLKVVSVCIVIISFMVVVFDEGRIFKFF